MSPQSLTIWPAWIRPPSRHRPPRKRHPRPPRSRLHRRQLRCRSSKTRSFTHPAPSHRPHRRRRRIFCRLTSTKHSPAAKRLTATATGTLHKSFLRPCSISTLTTRMPSAGSNASQIKKRGAKKKATAPPAPACSRMCRPPGTPPRPKANGPMPRLPCANLPQMNCAPRPCA